MNEQFPTTAEFEILDVLWEKGKGTVRYVHDKMSDKKDVTYTTTLKTMQNMHHKGFLKRESEGRGHIYYPAIERSITRKNMLNRFLENTFGGSSSELVMQLLGNHKTSQEELQKIRELIDQLENEK